MHLIFYAVSTAYECERETRKVCQVVLHIFYIYIRSDSSHVFLLSVCLNLICGRKAYVQIQGNQACVNKLWGQMSFAVLSSSLNPAQYCMLVSECTSTSVSFCISRTSHYSEANSLLIIVNGFQVSQLWYVSLTVFLHPKPEWERGIWFGFALVWICPFLLPFVFLDVCTFLLSSPVNSINDWRTRVFSCQLRKTFGTELRVSAWALTASRCFQQC